MPYFYGDNPAGWIRQCDPYFELSNIPEYMKVKLATAYISSRADIWLRGTGILSQHTLPTWSELCTRITDRFGEISSFDAMEQFQSLQQIGGVTPYSDKFEENLVLLKKDNPYLQEPFFIASFVRGLKQDIKHFVKCHQPKTLLDASWYARQLEQVDQPKKLQLSVPPRTSYSKPSSWKPPLPSVDKQSTSATTPPREPRKCYFCKENWHFGHKCKTSKSFTSSQGHCEGKRTDAV